MLEFRILGPLEAVDERGSIPLSGPKRRATLAILLLNGNRVVSVERLADALYEGAAPVTAVTQVQRQVSELRKALGASAIETRAPGYVIRLSPDQLDLACFERLTAEATQALRRGEAERATALFDAALALWRGSPLADFSYESFAQTAIERLEELRLAALEQRLEAGLVLGRHAELVPELEQLAAEHPLRERLQGQLMVALYRSGRQGEALDVYRRARGRLVDELGIEPTPALRDLERAVLTQDPALDLASATQSAARPLSERERAVLVLVADEERLNPLLAVAEPLRRLPGRELIVARLVTDESELRSAAVALNARKASLGVRTRTAAFTTVDAAGDAVRLATLYEVDLVLLDALPGVEGDRLPAALATIFARSPADVAVLVGSAPGRGGDGVFVPFGGGEHDWAALEFAAWWASTTGVPLRIVGTKADPAHGRRDASRLIADASLAVQRVAGVEAEPVLAERSDEGLVSAVESATVVVVGVSERWRRAGVGRSRRAILRHARPPVVLVHGGARPGGLAPSDARTRFTWTVDAEPYLQAVSTEPT